jgi:hypothetical protein
MFMMLDAYGIPAAENAPTKGLPVIPLPIWFHGVMANITVMAST